MHPHSPGTSPSAPSGREHLREPSTPPVDLTAALVAVAAEVGYDIDTDELPVVTGLRHDLVLAWVQAGSQIIVHRFLRLLLDDPIEVMWTATDNHGVSLHTDDLAEIVAFARSLEAALPALLDAYRTACRDIARTGLGMAWPIHSAPAPTCT